MKEVQDRLIEESADALLSIFFSENNCSDSYIRKKTKRWERLASIDNLIEEYQCVFMCIV